MARFLKNQLFLHYVLLGAAIYFVVEWQASGDNVLDRIVIDETYQQQLLERFEQQNHRRPTTDEFKELINGVVKQEVLWREAEKLGLNRNDEVIRRRMIAKMNFILEASATVPSVTEQTLRQYHLANKPAYRIPEKFSFTHITFPSYEKALAVWQQLKSEDLNYEQAQALGEQFIHGHRFNAHSAREIDKLLGSGFYEQLPKESGKLSGPLKGKYGYHLVWVEGNTRSRLAEFETVRSEVYRDWRLAEKAKVEMSLFNDLLSSYSVEIDLFEDVEGSVSFKTPPPVVLVKR